MSENKSVDTTSAATTASTASIAVEKKRAPREPQVPRAPTKKSFEKKRPFFVDVEGRQYFRHTTQLSEYFNKRVGVQVDGAESKNETRVFWTVLSGTQTTPLASSKLNVITKLGDEKSDKKHETTEVHVVDSSADKEVNKKGKTGWVIVNVSKGLLQSFEDERIKSIAEAKTSRLTKMKSVRVKKTASLAKRAQQVADSAAEKAGISSSSSSSSSLSLSTTATIATTATSV